MLRLIKPGILDSDLSLLIESVREKKSYDLQKWLLARGVVMGDGVVAIDAIVYRMSELAKKERLRKLAFRVQAASAFEVNELREALKEILAELGEEIKEPAK